MVLSIILGIVGSVLIGLVTAWYYQFFKYDNYFSKYKGPRPYPIFGNMLGISLPTDVIPVFMDFHKKHGPVIKMWFGYFPRLVTCEPKTIELLLTSNAILDKSYEYKFFEPWLANGLLLSTGAKWKSRRKLITPTFHFQILEQFISVFDSQGLVLINKLQEALTSGPVNVVSYISLFTMDVICEAAMGTTIKAQEGNSSDYVNAVHDINDIIIRRSFSPAKNFDFIYRFTTDYRKQQEALTKLHGQTNFVIESRRKELSSLEIDTTKSEDEFGIKKRKAFLDCLLQSRVDGEPLPPEGIREEVDMFMFAGHDTTTAGISFTLYCLSQNLDVQEKVVEELRSVSVSDDGTTTYQELQDMKYLEMVIKESMRLYPPVPAIARTLSETREFDGTVLPKGTDIMIFTYALHRQEEIYPNPEKFDPERFSAENSADRPTFAYIPFSAGPRNCLGQRFAMLEMKSAISKILKYFEVLPVAGFEPILSMTAAVLKSTNGIMINLKKRKF